MLREPGRHYASQAGTARARPVLREPGRYCASQAGPPAMAGRTGLAAAGPAAGRSPSGPVCDLAAAAVGAAGVVAAEAVQRVEAAGPGYGRTKLGRPHRSTPAAGLRQLDHLRLSRFRRGSRCRVRRRGWRSRGSRLGLGRKISRELVHGPGLSISQLVRAHIAELTELIASRRFRLTVYRKPVPGGQLPRPRLSITSRLTADRRQANRRDLAIRRRLTVASRLTAYRKLIARRQLTWPRLPVDRRAPGGRREVRAGQVTIYRKPAAPMRLTRPRLPVDRKAPGGRREVRAVQLTVYRKPVANGQLT